MIELNEEHWNQLRQALMSAFRQKSTLKNFVSAHFSFNLDEIASSQAMRVVVDDLIDYFREGSAEADVTRLILRLNQARPNNSEVKKLIQNLGGEDLIGGSNVSADIVQITTDIPLIESPNSTHLVIAAFWQERNKEMLRIRPKLCYRCDADYEIRQETLVKEDCSVALNKFPDLLKGLLDFAISKVANRFSARNEPWQLTIELFVPVDLLGRPLKTWCGKYEELWQSRAIVLGCSDRFDPDRPVDAADLHNQLKSGWQRFQAKVPDLPDSNLKNLDWLDSDRAAHAAFSQYAGFQCYGGWLVPTAESLENWQKLVRSGMPVALWICEEIPQRPLINALFDRLIDGNRFEFLRRIPSLREELQNRGNHRVGIFYEDPHYLPDIPLPKDEQFFSWPGA